MGNSNENKDNPGHDKEVAIIINGREKKWSKKEITFDEVVVLSELPTGENTLFTMTYRRGEGNKPEGGLSPGDTVRVKDGMIFNVTATDKS